MFNKAILIGRLVADPELRQTQSGVSVCSFRIAVDRPYTPKDGGDKQADFLDIVAWRQQAEFVSRYFGKGKLILVEGSIQARNYTDKNDQKRTAVEVVAENVRFVGSKADNQGGGSPRSLPDDSSAPPARMGGDSYAPPTSYASGSAEDFAEIEDDGDLPF
ncbi:MAG: single-stranded DNA-binding protein [Oscillospiraceae bacterium]|nr:single-stranded DNA-binding protein [Oscillospiraceae bacterium]